MKYFGMICCILAIALGSLLAQAQCPSPMVGETRILIKYSPGPNWSQFGQYLTGHLDFLLSQMKAGKIASAGPTSAEDGGLTGGLAKYALESEKEAKALAQHDPFVSNSVVNVESATWLECRLEK